MAGFAPEKVKQTYFLLALTLLTGLLAYMLRDYISSFLGATTIYILFRGPLHYLNETKKWPKAIVVTLLMIASLIILLLPLSLVSIMLSSKAQYMVTHYTELLRMVKEWNNSLSARFGANLLSDETIGKVTSAGANAIPAVLSGTFTSLAQIAVLYFLLYFMMMDGRTMEQWVLANSPFNNDNTALLTHELKIQTMSNAIGIPLLIIILGSIGGVGYWIFGMDEPLFWGVITGFASIIPIVGAAIIWIPVSVYMYFTGSHGKSIGMMVYEAALLVNVEHLVRFSLLKKIGNTHPLVTFFGIVLGISLFGFMGLIFGPLLISYFLILLSIYQKEYLHNPALLKELDPNER
jgi:predicted PurR-regulated permease PerM